MTRYLTTIAAILAFNAIAAGRANSQPQSFAPGQRGMPQPSETAMEMQYVGSLFYKYNAMGPRSAPPLPGAPSPFGAAGDGRDENGKPRWLDGAAGFNTLARLIIRLIELEQFADIDRLMQDWNDPAERTADGRWKAMIFRPTLESIFSQTGDWDGLAGLVGRWKRSNPASVSAALAEGIYWKAYAWEARGHGASSSVSELGWQLFNERLKKAEAALVQAKAYSADNPVWYETYLGIASTLGWEKAELFQLAAEAAGKHKYYFGLYFPVVNYSTPRWGGSWQLLDAFVAAATKNTQDREGKSVYARLYWVASQIEGVNFDLFEDSKATWSSMRAGFHDMMQRYPHSLWNANNYAAFACRAGDAKTFNELLPRIQGNIMRDAWPSNYSFDLCRKKFSKGTL